MKTLTNVSLCFSLCLTTSVYAVPSIVTDGTMGGVVANGTFTPSAYYNQPNSQSGSMTIPQAMGTTVGNNLFHSFSTFNINSGESATFTGAATLQNIISRVTGGQASNIDGLLKSEVGNANFYFINPAGVIFGANAVVDVPAAFHVSTANQINFADGVFSATSPSSNVSTFTADPVSFGFLANTSDITVIDSKITLKPKQTLDLVANNITVGSCNTLDCYNNPVKLKAGEIRLAAIQGANEVSLQRTNTGILPLPVLTPSSANAGNIRTVNGATFDTSSNDGGGEISLWAGDIKFPGNTKFLSCSSLGCTETISTSLGNAGAVNIVSNNLSLVATVIGTNSWNAGNAGLISLKVNNNLYTEWAYLTSSTYGTGNGNGISIKASDITLNSTSIYSNTDKNEASNRSISGTGHAGNIVVTANNLLIDGFYGRIKSEAGGSRGEGAVGKIVVNTGNLILRNQGRIGIDTAWTGASNQVTVNVDNLLTLQSGGTITNNTYWDAAGNININAGNMIIDGKGSQVSSTAPGYSIGNAGNITLKTDRLEIINGGQIINTTSNNVGNAGKIDIDANTMMINRNGSDDLTGVLSTRLTSNLPESNTNTAGDISLNVGQLSLLKGGIISSANLSNFGNASNININADTIFIDGLGKTTNSMTIFKWDAAKQNHVYENIPLPRPISPGISSDNFHSNGHAGTVDITTKSLNMINAGVISSDTFASGEAGKVNVKAGSIEMQSSSEISSSTAGKGNAGYIGVTSSILSMNNASIKAIAEAGSSGQTGNINVTATQALNLTNNAKISLQNDATVANPAAIAPTKLSVTAPDITLTNSSITTAATGNIKASDIVINFSDKLLMDPSYILTTANTGDGGSIYINGGNLIYLKDSGFLTSVSGASSNGGNIFVNAGFLIMDTGVIQANAIGGLGGDVNLHLSGLISSYDNLILGGSWVNWQPFVPGFNVIQAASETGVSGNVNITSPQFNISGITKALDAGSLVLPSVNRNPCQNSAGNSLKRGSKGGLPINEEKDDFIPAASVSQSQTTISPANTSSKNAPATSGESCTGSSI